jgi:hypothetical protein
MRIRGMFIAAFAGCLLSVPGVAVAQSAIAGVVRDTSGAVLPGVTVEASSDVLIEKSKSVVSDGNGQYRIIDLRPGLYKVTFTLTGFQTFQRDGIELPAEFTATVNADMKVGAIEETITVSGATPIVDISTAAHVQVLDRDSIDNLPTGRTIQSLGQMIVGVNLSLPDVGGSRAAMQTYMSVHGQSSANNSVMVDGLAVNGLEANGSVQGYFNDAASQEMSYQTSAIGAETSGGGVRLNLIPREGGNRFSGDTQISYRPGAWQGNNLTQRLKDAGLTAGNSTAYIVDFTVAQGGPIKRDKLWFFASYRDYDTNNRISNTFFDDGSQGSDFNYIRQGLGRITYQMSDRNKINGFWDQVSKYRGHDMQSLVDPETASVVWASPDYHTAGVKWTSTMTSRILVEAGFSENIEYRTTQPQDGIARERNTPEWFSNATRVLQTSTLGGRTTAPQNWGDDWPGRRNLQGSLSYVTGSHHLKIGAQWQWGTFYHSDTSNGDIVQRFSTAVKDQFGAVSALTGPVDVLMQNTPVQSQERLNADLGVFAQDSWTMKRLTMTAGIRWEYINSQVDTTEAPAGRFVPARTQPLAIDRPNWTDWAPRFQVAYDVFGNSKTAIKYSANRYNAAQAVSLAAGFNLLGRSSSTAIPWTDKNRDGIAQGARVWNAAGTAYTDCDFVNDVACELDLVGRETAFGTLRDVPAYGGFPRSYNIEQGLEIQHELFPRLSVTATYYRGYNQNLTTTVNRAVTPADYNEVQVFNPIDGTPITYYNISTAANARTPDSFTFNDPDRFSRYRSFSTEFRARPGGGSLLFGGVSWERELVNATSATATNCTIGRLQNPNQLRFCDRENLPAGMEIPFAVNARLNASIPLPWYGITVSGGFQSNDGGSQSVSYQITRGSTRYPANCPAPCPAGAIVLPTATTTAATATIALFPAGSGTYRNERLNQVDMKISKTFRIAGIRISPAFEAFNLTNSDMVITYSSTNWGTSTYLQPNSIVQGRVLGVSTKVQW